MAVITLLTDFGTRDGFVGVMKGVIWGIAPDAKIADLTHEISPQNIRQGAYLLGQSYSYFPAGSIHVMVVDPGVGTNRPGIAAKIDEMFFVAPDNGLITISFQRAVKKGDPVQIVQLDCKEYWLPAVSATFHGRDIFAPVAAHLARGVPITQLGTFVERPVLLDLPEPVNQAGIFEAEIILVDSFGNLITNFEESLLRDRKILQVKFQDLEIKSIAKTFANSPAGTLIAMFDSSKRLSICVVNGSAAQSTRAQVGDKVWLETGPI